MFSVVIATRDRPLLLRRALRSVAAQSLHDIELILVDDSVSSERRAEHEAVLREIVPSGTLYALPKAKSGHGPGAARNHGIAQATRPYLAFLDDDDEWIDPAYLEVAAAAIERSHLDLHIADQEAIRADGTKVGGPVWSEDLAQKLPAAGLSPDNGTFLVSPEQMMLSQGFAHLNATIVRRTLARDQLGGFDADIRYEEDRDFFLRSIDAAGAIGYTPRTVARHYVPAARSSASSIAMEEKERCRLRVLDKAIGSAAHPAIRAQCRRDRAYTLKRMSTAAAASGEFGTAIQHGRAALRDGFGLKWLLYLASLYVRGATARNSQSR